MNRGLEHSALPEEIDDVEVESNWLCKVGMGEVGIDAGVKTSDDGEG